MPGRRVPPPGSSAAGCAPALPQGDAAEGRRGSRPPCPALPCPALPSSARPGLQGQARVRLQREMPAVRDAGRGEEAARGTAALRNHPHTPPPPVARPPCGRAASRLSHGSCRHPQKGFGSRFTFALAPPRGSRGPRRPTGALAARGSPAAPRLSRLPRGMRGRAPPAPHPLSGCGAALGPVAAGCC